MKFLDEWKDFKDNVIPRSASRVQVNETKKAFYAGALAFISLLSNQFNSGDPEGEVTNQDINEYEALVSEVVAACKSFVQDPAHRMN